jgi:hypothetical protein
MAVRNLFSKRKSDEEKAGREDVYVYDDLPSPFRKQVIHIWDRAIGRKHNIIDPHSNYHLEEETAWDVIEGRIAEEHGLLSLGDWHTGDGYYRCANYFLSQEDVNLAIDVVDVSFDFINDYIRNNLRTVASMGYIKQAPDDAIEDLNTRFREHSIGYQFDGGQIIRVDSRFLHAEVVKPALRLLQGPGFSGPQGEFMQAHAHYRAGENEAAMTEAVKAFESVMKAICDARGWPYNRDKDTVTKLIEIVFQNNLIPSYLQSHFSSLRSVWEAGPTIRNKTGAHGAGASPRAVPSYVVAHVIHLIASNIVFLLEAHRASPLA